MVAPVAAITWIAVLAQVWCSNALSMSSRARLVINTEDQFIIISSPTQAKVSYAQLVNFQCASGQVLPLISHGLAEPTSIALDLNLGILYVADRNLSAIFSWNIFREGNQLHTTGSRVPVMEGRLANWLAVDADSNLLYSSGTTNNINKIPFEVLRKVRIGDFTTGSLTIVSEKTQEGQAQVEAARAIAAKNSGSVLPVDPPGTQPVILSMYEASANPHVTEPGALVVDGSDLYWTNQAGGTTAGTVVKGQVDPQPTLDASGTPMPFPATAITNATASAYGLAKSSNAVFYTSTTTDGVGIVEGLPVTGGTIYTFANGLMEPRGMEFDGDQTVYVADTVMGQVYSFSAGRMMDLPPLGTACALDGAYDVALLRSSDKAYSITMDLAMAQGQAIANGNVQTSVRSAARGRGSITIVGLWALLLLLGGLSSRT